MITGRLGYNGDNDRYGLLVSDLWEHEGFRCGEGLEVMVDGKWIATRMEMSADGDISGSVEDGIPDTRKKFP